MKTKLLFPVLLAATLLRAESIPSPSPSSSPLASSILSPDDPSVKSWRDRRFGMFIHWGPVSLKGTEIGWSRAGARRDRKETIKKGIPAAEYDELYKGFNPVKFNADEWVATAKAAGMKYIVLVAKHHDGFCMFDSALTDYKITSTPFGRDVTAELAEACRKQGLAFGVYYSPPDWHHPDFCTADHARYVAYMHGQVKELLTKYGPLSTVWFDRTGGTNDPSTWNNPELFRMIRDRQPSALVTTRCGGTSHEGLWGDYVTPEQKVGEFNIKKPWETCMTICRQWAWKPNDQMKSLKQCLQNLIVSAGGDGNLLFNVGPTPEGLIEPRQVERLKEMGEWLSKYGESIYGTRGGPYMPTKYAVSTRKGNSVYVHILKWPHGEEAMMLPPLPAKITGSKILTGGSVTVEQTDDGVKIAVPTADRKEIDTLVRLDLDRKAMEIEPIAVVLRNPLSDAKASASSVLDGKPDFAAGKAADGNSSTRWAAAAVAAPVWLEFEFPKPMTFVGVEIEEPSCSHVEEFEFQAKEGDAWKTLFSGKKIGSEFISAKFPAVTATAVRLNILKSKGAPSISEIRLTGDKSP